MSFSSCYVYLLVLLVRVLACATWTGWCYGYWLVLRVLAVLLRVSACATCAGLCYVFWPVLRVVLASQSMQPAHLSRRRRCASINI
jgi:hypothetical protein